MATEHILVLDFGGQYTQLIARSVRHCHVFSEIKDCNYSIGDILRNRPKGIILSGGPSSTTEKGAPYINAYILELGIPALGICYGMQHMNHLLGGGILRGEGVEEEYGEEQTLIDKVNPLFQSLEDRITVWMSHGDSVDGKKLAPGFKVIAESASHVAAIADNQRKLYGVQFHPEVTHTPQGLSIISNFVHSICGCTSDWNMGNYVEECKAYIRETVGQNDVICFVSGGVDSSFVAAVLAQTQGIGRVFPVYIGALMRKGENEEVVANLKAAGLDNLIFYEAEDRFIKAVEGLSEPNAKRRAIGNLFGAIQQELCTYLGLDPSATFLAQGTLYTDLIESGHGVGKKAAVIKLHHNVGCEFIDALKAAGRIVEPNRLIFKDEAREAARKIGLPRVISERQPYPGPGLAIRIVDSLPEWLNDSFYATSDKVHDLARAEGFEGYILPVKTVGVQGDERTYSHLAMLRGQRDWATIRKATKRIPREIKSVNRIVYDIGQGPLERTCIDTGIRTLVNRETIDQLKVIDYEVRKIIDAYGFTPAIDQTIVVLMGADIYGDGKRSVVLRGVLSPTYMTCSPIEPKAVFQPDLETYRKDNTISMSWECLDEIHQALMHRGDVGAFLIDVTDKPPATTCFE